MEKENIEAKDTETKKHAEMHDLKIRKKKLNVFVLMIVILAVVFIINLALITSIGSTIKEKLNQAKETSKPANLDLVLIKDSNCGNDCYNLNDVIEVIKGNN